MATTIDNLKEAFAGESQANQKYLNFAKKAEQDGFKNISKLFRLTAEATARLMSYRFPGNVRELRNIAVRLTTKLAGKEVGVHDLEAELDLGHESPTDGVPPAPIGACRNEDGS